MFENRRGRLPVALKNCYPAPPIAESPALECSSTIPFGCLQEGDIIVLRGRKLTSRIVGLWSRGASHVGQLMKLDGELWFVDSVSWLSDESVVRYAGDGGKGCGLRSGVIGRALPPLLRSYTHSAVYRPVPGLTDKELDIMRDEFKRLHGSAYEKRAARLLNSIPALPQTPPETHFYCSQLTAHFFRKINRLRRDFSHRRFRSGAYLPSQIVRAIDTRYMGCLPTTVPLPLLVPKAGAI